MYLQPQGCYFLIQKWHLIKIFWEFHVYQAELLQHSAQFNTLVHFHGSFCFIIISQTYFKCNFFTYTCIFKNILNLITFITCSWMYPPSANSDSLNSFAFHFLEGLGHDLSSNISKFIFSILLPIMINMDDFHALSKSKCQI